MVKNYNVVTACVICNWVMFGGSETPNPTSFPTKVVLVVATKLRCCLSHCLGVGDLKTLYRFLQKGQPIVALLALGKI